MKACTTLPFSYLLFLLPTFLLSLSIKNVSFRTDSSPVLFLLVLPPPQNLVLSHILSSMRVTLKSNRSLPPPLPFETVSVILFSTSTHNFHSPRSIFTLCNLTSVPPHPQLIGLAPKLPAALDILKPEPLLSSHPPRTSCFFRPCGSLFYEALASFLPSVENHSFKVTPPLKVTLSCCSSPTSFGCQCPLNLCPQIPSQTTHPQP